MNNDVGRQITEEEVRKIAEAEMTKAVMKNIDSAFIFSYVRNLETKIKELENKLAEKEHTLESEFISKMRELDPFFAEDEPTLDTLYEHFRTAIKEFYRLEDIEDNTVEMMAEIDFHRENIKKIKEMISNCKGV